MDVSAARIWRRRARGPFAALTLVALCLAVYVPGMVGIGPIDRDESRFAQASRQMLESVTLPADQLDPELHRGGLVVPRVGGRDRLNKPPLIYWLQSASAYVSTGGDSARDAIWMYRVPSVIGALLAVLITWRIGCSMFDPRVGWLAGALLAVAPVVVIDAHQARADQVLLACTTGAMWGLWNVFRASHAGRGVLGWALLMWLFIAAGVMTKGPITPMVVVLSALAFSWFGRDWRWLGACKPLMGVAIVVASVAPWVYFVAQHVGFDQYWAIISDEVFGRSGSAKEGHWGPPGYHLVLLVALFWPGSMLTGLAFGWAWKRGVLGRGAAQQSGGFIARVRSVWRGRAGGMPAYAFLVAWILPSWIVFELVATKLPHYTLPLYPALAILSARAVFALDAGALPGAAGRGARIGFLIWMLVGIAAAIAVASLGYAVGGTTVVTISVAVCAAAVVSIVRAGRDLLAGRAVRAQLRSLAAVCAVLIVFVGLVAPRAITLSGELWSVIEAFDHDGERPVASAGYHEDSMIFQSRGRIEMITIVACEDFTACKEHLENDEKCPNVAERWRKASVEWFESNPEGLLITPIESVPPGASMIAELRGYNMARGRSERLVIVENK